MSIPRQVRIVEVAPRDGLQNESTVLETHLKIELINRLSQCGFQDIEVTSFVSPKRIPQLADHSEVFKSINKSSAIRYWTLVPNMQGFEEALKVGVQNIAIFTAASETFNQKN